MAFHIIKVMILFGLILSPLQISSRDVLVLNQIESVAYSHMFGLAEWEIVNLSDKWLYKAINLFPWQRTSYEDGAAKFDRYFELSYEIENMNHKINISRSPDNKEDTNNLAIYNQQLADLIDEQMDIRSLAEEYLEQQISSILKDEKITSKFGLVFPPTNFRFQNPPKLLVISPRNKIERLQDILLKQQMSIDEMEILEAHALDEENLSAVILNIGGIATYPAIIPPRGSKRHVIETAAHEWLHHYFFFKELGKHFGDSSEMISLNETIANVIGEELSGIICTKLVRLNQQCEFSKEKSTINNANGFNFGKEMRETRLMVEDVNYSNRMEFL